MRHLKAIGIKFLITATVLFSMLSIFATITVGEILLISLLVTGIAYIIGDLLILPRTGNLIATIADFGLAFASIWILSYVFVNEAFPIITISLFTAFFLSICEAIFHIYMKERILVHDDDKHRYTNAHFQTEAAEEEDINKFKEKDKQTES